MPLYYKNHARGYDLDLEHEFVIIDGEKCMVGTAGSTCMVCSTCGEEHFRDSVSQYESCFKGHGRMYPLKLSDLPKYREIWMAQGDTIVPVEERRARRLTNESVRPWNWVFGDKTEADFQNGYVKDC